MRLVFVILRRYTRRSITELTRAYVSTPGNLLSALLHSHLRPFVTVLCLFEKSIARSMVMLNFEVSTSLSTDSVPIVSHSALNAALLVAALWKKRLLMSSGKSFLTVFCFL